MVILEKELLREYAVPAAQNAVEPLSHIDLFNAVEEIALDKGFDLLSIKLDKIEHLSLEGNNIKVAKKSLYSFSHRGIKDEVGNLTLVAAVDYNPRTTNGKNEGDQPKTSVNTRIQCGIGYNVTLCSNGMFMGRLLSKSENSIKMSLEDVKSKIGMLFFQNGKVRELDAMLALFQDTRKVLQETMILNVDEFAGRMTQNIINNPKLGIDLNLLTNAKNGFFVNREKDEFFPIVGNVCSKWDYLQVLTNKPLKNTNDISMVLEDHSNVLDYILAN
jgi:soluble cytochrome b562